MTAPPLAKDPVNEPSGAEHSYRADIDGLRAIAVLAVVGYHAFPKWMSGGFVGVDVFFVISGFLISSILIRQIDNGDFSFTGFYARRIKRIFPALAVVLVACYAFGWFALLAEEYKQMSRHIAGGAGFLSNFVLWEESGYFDNEAETKPLLHLWSLGVEEQFYLAWPLVLYVALRLRVTALNLVLALGGASFALNVALVHNDVVAAFYSPATRFWELALGGVLACVTPLTAHGSRGDSSTASPGRTPPSRLLPALDCGWRRSVASTAGAAGVAGSILFLDKWQPFPGWWALLPTVGTGLLIASGPAGWLNRHVLSRRPLVWIGLISYPLYLWHWPLLSFLRITESAPPARALRIGAVLVSIVLAWLTYVLVERPIRLGTKSPLKVALPCVAMALIGCVGYATFKQEGFGFRLQALEEQVRVIKAVIESTPSCKAAIPVNSRYCLLTDPSRLPSVALIGDSHANRLFSALSSRYAQAGENLVQLGGGDVFHSGISRPESPAS